MIKFTPTEEQQIIVEAVRSTQDNMLVSALAGAAKTSTLVLVAQAQQSIPILCLAFNKRIADEMKDRLPRNCEAMTLNSIGHRTWAKFIGRRLTINPSKTYEMLRAEIDKLDGDEKTEAFDLFIETLRAIDSGKTAGWIPDGTFPDAKRLMSDGEFFEWLDEEPTELQERLICKVTYDSLCLAVQGVCDYNDQILMPTLFPATFHQYPLVLVDETQDLSALNHMMVSKIAKKRLIAVGDQCQSIYGFRGAHQDSMSYMKKRFQMTEYTLSVTFRCPRKVVEAARWRAPHMKYPDWAQEGAVTHKTSWDEDTIPESAAIVCRNNAPLFSIAMKLLKAGRYPQILGNDIGKALLKIMKKFGPTSLSKEDLARAIDEWQEGKLEKARDKGKIIDQAACMRVFASVGNLGDAIAYAEHIFNQSGPIKLMTVHKAKGLEFDHVFILDRDLIRTEYDQQEKNLLYVAQTRAKVSLTYITSEGFEDA